MEARHRGVRIAAEGRDDPGLPFGDDVKARGGPADEGDAENEGKAEIHPAATAAVAARAACAAGEGIEPVKGRAGLALGALFFARRFLTRSLLLVDGTEFREVVAVLEGVRARTLRFATVLLVLHEVHNGAPQGVDVLIDALHAVAPFVAGFALVGALVFAPVLVLVGPRVFLLFFFRIAGVAPPARIIERHAFVHSGGFLQCIAHCTREGVFPRRGRRPISL